MRIFEEKRKLPKSKGEKSIIKHHSQYDKDWLKGQIEEMLEELENEDKKVVRRNYGRTFIEWGLALSKSPKYLVEPKIAIYEVPSWIYFDPKYKIYWKNTGSFD